MQELGKPQDIKLLDFQLVCNGTPVFDLSYCLYSGSSGEVLSKLDDYLQIYHSSLSETLNEFDLNSETIYPFKTLKEEWKKYCKYGFPFGMVIWRGKLADNDDIPNYSNGNCKIKIPEDREEEYKKRVRELIIHLHNNDFL